MSLTRHTEKLHEASIEYFHSFDHLTEKQTLRPALKYLASECEKILARKDIDKAKASKQRAEMVLNGARLRLRMLEETQ